MKRFFCFARQVLFLMPFLCGIVLATTASSNNYASSPVIGAEVRESYKIVVNSVTDNDTNLTASTSYWDALGFPTKFKSIDAKYASMEFIFVVDGNDHKATGDGNDPNLTTFHFRIMGARWLNSAVVLCSGDANCGELILSRDPVSDGSAYSSMTVPYHKYVSGVTNFVDNWRSCSLLDYTESDNGIARIKINDIRGYSAVWCETSAISGNPGRIKCLATGW
jgi:hypothetical protein